MTTDPFDLDDDDARQRSRRGGRRYGSSARAVDPRVGAVQIDAMLDRIDSVLQGRAEPEESSEPGISPLSSAARVISRLRDLAEDLARLRALAESCADPEVAAFARESRARAEQIISRRPRVGLPASGAIEVEMDYQTLHDFLLDPDLDRICG